MSSYDDAEMLFLHYCKCTLQVMAQNNFIQACFNHKLYFFMSMVVWKLHAYFTWDCTVSLVHQKLHIDSQYNKRSVFLGRGGDPTQIWGLAILKLSTSWLNSEMTFLPEFHFCSEFKENFCSCIFSS